MMHVGWRLLRRAATNLWRAPLPSVVAVITIGLALFLGAALAFSIASARALLVSWGAQPSVTAYLDPAVPDEQARALAERLRSQEHVDVVLVSKRTALERLRVQLGNLGSAVDDLPANPLPGSLEVILPRSVDLRAFAQRIATLPGVREVDYGREWVDRIEALGGALRQFGTAALVLVSIAALLVVANTIRLAVYARREEIDIMKLVGATDSYVRLPFVIEGALQGICGAVLAIAALAAVQRFVLPRAAAAFAFASGVPAPHFSTTHGALLVGAGAVVGLCGSYLAVARFLRA
jgi:cell division transport system permease protein